MKLLNLPKLVLMTSLVILSGRTSVTHAQQVHAETPRSADYLVHDVNTIVILDESRCSVRRPSCDSGKAYIIQGKDNIARIRSALKKIDEEQGGVCGCGGPDIHYFCTLSTGETQYFGLDCDTFLGGYLITDEVRQLIAPTGSQFLGKPMGYVLVANQRNEQPGPELEKAVTLAGYEVVLAGKHLHTRNGTNVVAVIVRAPCDDLDIGFVATKLPMLENLRPLCKVWQ